MSGNEKSDQPAPAAETTTADPVHVFPGTAEPAVSSAAASVDPAAVVDSQSNVSSAPSLQDRPKTRGVADLVFVVDISGSMAPCIDALRKNIETFIDSLSQGGANNAAPVKDWRGKVVGYRDIEAAQGEGLPWIVDHPFVRDAAALKAQLGTLQANGGGDEPESLLDALYKLPRWRLFLKGLRRKTPRSGDTEAMRHGSSSFSPMPHSRKH
jgi:hypothetical protein